MQKPEMKQEYDLSAADFLRHPAWVGVHNYDSGEPWYKKADEETFRPWLGPLPFVETRGFVLVSATFDLADGSSYSGFCRSVGHDWDMSFESMGGPRSWTETHGGGQLSVLGLQCPTLFVDDRQLYFELGAPKF